jgi:branched-chain amino acid transport system ATP-binding protein
MLEVIDLYVAYYMDVFILKGVSLNIKSGKITAVIGPNGAGKSTLLRSIVGLIPKKRGRVIFDGYDITNEAPHRLFHLGMTYIPQHRSVFPWLTVHENLIMGSQGLAKNQLKAKLNEIYEQYPVLKNKKHDLAMNLSGGQQRMLEFARAMLREPKVMLIDEPTTALDPKSTKLVYDEISKLKNKNIAILLVDQNVRMAVEICDFLAVMRDGQIIIQRDKENIRDQIIDIVKEWLI